jgi:RNAse (barnase) inhibitor barstar
MNKFKYLSEQKLYDFSNLNNSVIYIAYIKEVKDEDELFDDLSISLKFPDYFGVNWDAVYDCLRDFSWISQRKIVLIHRNIDVNVNFLSTYIEVLYCAIQSWKENEEHEFEVVFPTKCEPIIEKIVNQINYL